MNTDETQIKNKAWKVDRDIFFICVNLCSSVAFLFVFFFHFVCFVVIV